MKEIFKPIFGYEEIYYISNLGNVKIIESGKILKSGKNRGYLTVNLSKKGVKKTFRVHRLVANAFLENTKNYEEVNHIDENKENNRVDNLEWCDRKYNMNYKGIKKRISQSLQKPIVSISETGLVRVFNSSKQAAIVLGVNRGNISSVLTGKRKKANKLYFKFQSFEVIE